LKLCQFSKNDWEARLQTRNNQISMESMEEKRKLKKTTNIKRQRERFT